MKIAASFSMGRLAPKHDLNIHGSRVMSKNVTQNLIKDDVILVDHLRTHKGAYQSINEYTDKKLQPYIDRYNAKQRRQDRCTPWSWWRRHSRPWTERLPL